VNISFSRIVIVSAIIAVFIVPLYAHHGAQLLTQAIELNAAEVRMGQLADMKAQNSRVKDYAQMLVRDHTESLNKANDLLNARLASAGVASKTAQTTKNAADVKLTPEHQHLYDRLSSLSGADFDREYMNAMVNGHREAIQMFEVQTHAHGNAISGNKSTTSNQQTTRQKPTAPDEHKYSRAELRRDVDAAQFANDTLPTLRNHLQQAESIQKELQGK
jgi:predicted outer membrane protein